MCSEIGTRFEMYVQLLFSMNGIDTEHNVRYHKGVKRKKTCQVDLESKTGILFKTHTIYECKYVSPGNSTNFTRYFIQLGEAMLFTGADKGILVTNARIPQRTLKERNYNIRIYDQLHLLALRHDDTKSLERQVADMEREIRKMPYNPKEDHKFVHKYI